MTRCASTRGGASSLTQLRPSSRTCPAPSGASCACWSLSCRPGHCQGHHTATGLRAAVVLLCSHPQVLDELRALLPQLAGRIDHLHLALAERPDGPLRIHARYSRVEILAAFGVRGIAKVAPWHQASSGTSLRGPTCSRSRSTRPTARSRRTTRYRDYAISRDLIRWESLSTTQAASETGRRYLSPAVRIRWSPAPIVGAPGQDLRLVDAGRSFREQAASALQVAVRKNPALAEPNPRALCSKRTRSPDPSSARYRRRQIPTVSDRH